MARRSVRGGGAIVRGGYRVRTSRLPVHARRFEHAFRGIAPLNRFDNFFVRLSETLMFGKTIPDHSADVDADQRSPARTKLRRLIGAIRLFGNFGSDGIGRESASAHLGL